MKISDRVDNRVIANTHPLLAAAVLQLSAGNKHRIEWVDHFTVIVHNEGDFFKWPGFGRPAIGATRACPDCGKPQHYTGTENGWAHDATIATWECNDPAKAGLCGNCGQPMSQHPHLRHPETGDERRPCPVGGR